jgi:alpha-L-fucosidase
MAIRALGALALAAAAAAAAPAAPTAPQLAWQGGFGSIIHFNMATAAGTQGCNPTNWAGASNPQTFGAGLTPESLAAAVDGWGKTMQSAGITYAIYVAKHSCGFPTWPTNVTLPDGSP